MDGTATPPPIWAAPPMATAPGGQGKVITRRKGDRHATHDRDGQARRPRLRVLWDEAKQAVIDAVVESGVDSELTERMFAHEKWTKLPTTWPAEAEARE